MSLSPYAVAALLYEWRTSQVPCSVWNTDAARLERMRSPGIAHAQSVRSPTSLAHAYTR